MPQYITIKRGLSSRNPWVRKGTESLLRIPKFISSMGVKADDRNVRPPVLINSIPKSGTHLLMQIVEGLPNCVNYGEWVATMTGSFRFRECPIEKIARFIHRMLPGEIARGHLCYDARLLNDIDQCNVVNYFIYRDPRAIAVSSTHYLRSMNSWHRLHKYFRSTTSLGEALVLNIRGLPPSISGVDFPDIGRRLDRYQGWLGEENCFAVRYEDLQSEARPDVLRQMAQFYASRTSSPVDVEACVRNMISSIAPEQSHTFRSGQRSGWQQEFTRQHREMFHEVAGDLLVDWGYETDASWIEGSRVAT